MNVPGQDVPGNLQDLMSSQGSVLLLKKCGIMLQHLCLDNFSMMQFRQTSWLKPVCCKKQQKKVPDQLLVCGIGDL